MRIKHGAIVVDSSGKSGGQFISKGKSGSVLRTVANSVRKKSSSQLSQRAQFRSVGSAWSALSSSQRGTWNAAALELRMSDGFGDDMHLSGFQLFKSYNQNLLSSGFSIVNNFGGLQSIAPMTSLSFVLSAYDQSLLLTFAPVVPAGISFKVFATPVLSAGVSNPSGKFKKIADLSSSDVSGVDIGSEYVSVFGRVPDYAGAVWLYVVPMVEASGQLGSILSAYYSKPLEPGATFGLQWSDLGQQFGQSQIISLYMLSSGICLAGTIPSGKILRSIDSGATWSDLGQQFSQTEIYSIYVLDSGICLAGTSPNGKILRSIDSGATWSDLGQQFSQTHILSLAMLSSGVCLAGTLPSGKILRSIDFGATWSDLGQQFSQTHIYSLAMLSSGVCLAGTYPSGKILRSTDFGTTWSDLGQQFSQTIIYSLAAISSGVCLAGTYPGGKILRSTDFGATWSDLGQQFSQTHIRSIFMLSSGVCLAGTIPDGKILRSTDFGATWSDLGQQFSQTHIRSVFMLSSGVCLAGTVPDGKILRSVPI